MKLRALFSLLAAVVILAGCEKENYSPQQDNNTTTVMNAGPVIKGSVIVKFSEVPQTKSVAAKLPEIGITHIERLIPENPKYAARHKEHGLDRWYKINFNPDVSVSSAYGALKSMEIVETVDFVPVTKRASESVPFNDPYLSHQWHYHNTGQQDGYVAGMDINLFKAWEVEKGNQDVIVAIMDEGVMYNHQDLAKNMWVNEAEKNGAKGVDDDNNGYIDDIHGYNFCSSDGVTLIGTIQPGDHGTHVAGTIAAVNGNGILGCGVAGGDGTDPGVRIMVCQKLNAAGDYSDNASAYVYAADNGAVISQNSWGYLEPVDVPAYLVAAIEYFNKYAGMDPSGKTQVGPMAGGITIFAAGNDNREVSSPAMIDQVLAVAATGPTGRRGTYSCYGKWVDISAPGGEGSVAPAGYIYSTVTENKFGGMVGTSMACPHVSGVAALVVSRYGGQGFTNTHLKESLLKSADYNKLYDVNPDFKGNKTSSLISTPDKLGAGALDAYKAVTYLGDVEDDGDDDEPTDAIPDPVTKVEATATPNSITVTWEATETAGKPTFEYNLYISEKDMSGMDLNPNDYIEGVSFDKVHGDGKKAGEKISYTFNNTKHSTTYYLAVQSESVTFKYSEVSPQISITTPANLPPAISPDENIAVTLKATQKQSFEFNISDPENDDLTIWLEEESEVVSLKRAGNTATITIDASKGKPGTYSTTLNVRDIAYNSASVNIEYTILPNSKPERTKEFGNLVLGKGESTTFNLEEYFSDADGDKLSYALSTTESSVADCSIQGNTLTIYATSYGTTKVDIAAKDGKNALSPTSSIQILVRNTKEAADVYPTSVQSTLNIRTATDGNADILITGASGAAVYTKTSVATGPFNPHTINASEWGAGVYSVEVTVNGKKCKKTVVKL
ncbi:MAG: S8 family serine peptidase [Bacteroidales bacterium]|nr:S8 family serine peptidase [Bacteroidales bacterium]